MRPGDTLFGRYRVVRWIARGGMGTVWQGHDLLLDQPVALKHVALPPLGAGQLDDSRRRTLREARNAAQLRGHPHVVAIYDVRESEDGMWLVLEYVPSRSLAEVLDGGARPSLPDVARIGAAVARALAAAHERGIAHRDVKPGNVLLAEADGVVKLTDFGIAHADGEPALTASGVVSGTPAYMSPEVARGAVASPASDVFSLGATLYAAVEGSPPFGHAENPRALIYRIATDPVPPPVDAGPLTPLLTHLLAADAAARPDAGTAARALAGFADGRVAGPIAAPQAPPPTGPHRAPMVPPPPHGAGSSGAATDRRRRRLRLGVVAAALTLGLGTVGTTLVVTNLPDAAGTVTGQPAAGPAPTSLTVGALIELGVQPTSVAASPQGDRLYTADTEANSVTVIDTTGGAVVATVPVPGGPFETLVSPDGRRVYVATISSPSVTVIDTAKAAVLGSIRLGDQPNGMATNRDGSRLFVTGGRTTTLKVVDTGSYDVLASIPTGLPADSQTTGVAVNGEGTVAWVTSYQSESATEIDLVAGRAGRTIPTGQNPRHIVLTPDGRRAYVTNYSGFGVTVFDTATGAVLATVPAGGGAGGLAITPDGRRVLFTSYSDNTVSVLDTATNTVTATTRVGSGPDSVAISPNGRTAYVANANDVTLSPVTIS